MITRGPYTLDTEALTRLAMDISDLRRKNYEIIIVTSAAIAAGMALALISFIRPQTSIATVQSRSSAELQTLENSVDDLLDRKDNSTRI